VLFIGTIVGVGGMVIAAFIKKQHDDVMLVAACIAISVVCSRLISPQYLVWLAPFIALRVTTQRSIVVLYAMSLVLSFAVLYDYDYFANHVGTWIDAVAVLRNVILVTLTIVMIRAALFPKPADATSGPSISRTNVRGNA
jgi:hypothetical protein